MITPDDLAVMNEQEKLDVLRQFEEAEEWQEAFEPVYRRLMDDESPKVRQEAIAALWDLADSRHIEPLLRKAESDPDIGVRAKAASVLGIYIYEAVSEGGIEEGPGRGARRQRASFCSRRPASISRSSVLGKQKRIFVRPRSPCA